MCALLPSACARRGRFWKYEITHAIQHIVKVTLKQPLTTALSVNVGFGDNNGCVAFQ